MAANSGERRYEKTKEQVTDWLRTEGYEVVNAPESDALWCVVAHQNAIGFGVGQKIVRTRENHPQRLNGSR